MTWCAFAVPLWVLFLDNVHCGKVCKYEIKGIEGFHGEIKLDGPVYSSTPVFPIVFLVEGHPLSDWRYAVLQNPLEVQYFTVYSVLHSTNEIRARKTVPVGVSEVLQIGPESVNECTFYLTVTVGPSVLETTKTSTVTTFMSTSTLMASTLPSTVREDSTAISTTAVTPTRTASFSSASSSQHTTEFVTPRDCRYEIQRMKGFDDEIIVEGPIFIATTVFSIIFLKEGNPLPGRPYAILKNPQEVHYFTITINTNEIMAYRTVPLGTSEVLEIGPESVDECTFYLTVSVGSSMTKTLMLTSRITSSIFPSITSPSTAMSASHTGNIELSTTSSNPWTMESVTLGVCKYEIQGIEGFVGEINVDGPLFIVTTVFHIKFIMDGNPLPDSKRAVLKNHHVVQYFTVTSNTNEIMATQTVSVGTSEVLEISPDGVDECTFYMTVNVQDSVITTTAETTSFGPRSSTTPPTSSSVYVSMTVVSTVTGDPTTTSTKPTVKLTSANALSTVSPALTHTDVTLKSITSILSTMLTSNSSYSVSFTVSTSVNSHAVSPMIFSDVVFRDAFRLISILVYGIILSCF